MANRKVIYKFKLLEMSWKSHTISIIPDNKQNVIHLDTEYIFLQILFYIKSKIIYWL